MKKNVLRLVYSLLMVLVTGAVFVLSITTITDNGDRYRADSEFDVARAYGHVERIAKKEHPRLSEAHGEALDYIAGELESYGLTPVIMDYAQGYTGGAVLVPDTRVRNILVEFKGTASEDILVLMAHTDSVPMGTGASDDTLQVAAMMELARQIKTNNLTFKNTVVFLFTDGEEEGLYGARKLADKAATAYIGRYQSGAPTQVTDAAEISHYENLADKTKFVLNFEMRGTGGSLVMFETSKNNYNSVANFAKINDNIYTNSIANFIYSMMPNGTDFSAFSNNGIQGLNFASIGDGYNYHTQDDGIHNFKKSVLAQSGGVMRDCIDLFGNIPLAEMYESNKNAVFFSYLDLFTVVYPPAVVVVFSVLTLLLLAGAAAMNLKFKKYRLKKLLLALASNVLALGAAVLVSFLLKTVLGAIPALGRLLGSPSFNTYLPVFGYFLVMLGVFVAAQSLLNKLFKNKDASEYNSLAHGVFIALIGCVVSFILPEISILLSPAGFAAAVVIAVSASVPNLQFKRLWLGFVPCLVMLPVTVSFMFLAADALGLTLGFITPVLGILALGFVLPYLADACAFFTGRIPVTSRDDGRVKRCLKATGRSGGYIASGVSVLTGVILLLTLLSFPLTLSTNLHGKAGQSMAMIDDAVIYRTDGTSGRFYVYDRAAFEYLDRNYGLSGEYETEGGGYALELTGAVTAAQPQIATQAHSGYFEIGIAKAYAGGRFEVRIPFDSGDDTSVSKIVVTDANGAFTFTKNDFIGGMTAGKTIVFRSRTDAVIRVYTDSDTLEFIYAEEVFTPLDVAGLNGIRAAEAKLRTGIRFVKTYTI